MILGKFELDTPLILGPMAGVTDWAFRQICSQLGADITVTEMVSSRALVYQDKKSKALLKRNHNGLCGALDPTQNSNIGITVQNLSNHIGELAETDSAGHAFAAGLGLTKIQKV